MAYDPKKAAAFNQLRQAGLSEDAAAAQAGITDSETGDYVIGSNGQMGPYVTGSKVAGVDYEKYTPAQQAEAAAWDKGLQSVNFDETSKAQPSSVTPTNYTTTSTETVSGGGTTSVLAGPRQATAESKAIGAAYDAKQTEYNQFLKDNPSDFVRKRQGLPPMTAEEKTVYQQKLDTLNKEKADLQFAQMSAETPGNPTVITTPNTTTTTTTVVAGTSAVNAGVNTSSDPKLAQQNEIQLDTTSNAINGPVAISPAVPTSDPAATLAAPTVPTYADHDIPVPVDTVTNTPTVPTYADHDIPVPVSTSSDPGYADFDIPVQNYADHDIPIPVSPEEDPFEAARLAAEAQGRETPTEADLNVGEEDPEVAAMLEQQQFINREILAQEAVPVEPGPGIGQISMAAGPSFGELPEDERASIAGDAAQAGRDNAQRQKTLQATQNRFSQGDWRVRIHLAAGSNYLYNSPVGRVGGLDLPGPGILGPLADTDGVLFPYTPTIETSYQAKYQTTDLTHSNYRGYFYQGSYVDAINVRGTFTAQDTKEAQYLLAVIHFFRSVTKMFYGQGQNVGTPPPLVFLSGLGQYQFNKHPCVVSNFNYSLPNDVDYIRADGFNNYGLNLENRRNLSSGPAGNGSSVLGFLANKLGANGLNIGGLSATRPAPGAVKSSISNTTNQNSTYVPTKMEISVQLLPIQTRSQVSQQFSLQAFGDGNLLKGGFW